MLTQLIRTNLVIIYIKDWPLGLVISTWHQIGVHVDFGEREKRVLKARFDADVLWLQFYWGSFEMPGIDHLQIGRNCFSLEKDLLFFNLNPNQLCYLLLFLHHLIEGKKNKIKFGVQVKHCRGFVWLCSHAFFSLYIGINYVPQLVPLALLWVKKWPTNLRIKSCWANEKMQHALEA
jgi:hypothetical protein